MKDGIPIDRIDDVGVDNAFGRLRRRFAESLAVYLTYPRNGAWSGDNQLGYEVPFELNAATPQSIIKLDEWGFPMVWTVSLAIRLDTELPAATSFSATATVAYGAGGITQTFEVDLVDGVMFSLPMNAIDIKAISNQLAGEGFGTTNPLVHVSTILARGSVALARATRTFPNVPAPNSEPVDVFAIPRFSKSVSVTPVDVADDFYADATFKIQFYTNSAPAGPLQTVLGTRLGPGVKVPIPSGALYWSVDDVGGAGKNVNVIFNLFDE